MFRLKRLCRELGIIRLSESEFVRHYGDGHAFLVLVRGIEGTLPSDPYSAAGKETDKVGSDTKDIEPAVMPVFPLEADAKAKTYRIGRSQDSDIVLANNPSVSRRHATLSHSGPDWRVRNLSTSNGTRLFYDRDPKTMSKDIAPGHGRLLEDRVTIEVGFSSSPDWLLFLKDAQSLHRFVHQTYVPLLSNRDLQDVVRPPLKMYRAS